MIKNGYLMVGIIYIIVALSYIISILISSSTTIIDILTKNDESNKSSDDSKSLAYKIYWYYNNFRYCLLAILYILIGIIYVMSQSHENALKYE